MLLYELKSLLSHANPVTKSVQFTPGSRPPMIVDGGALLALLLETVCCPLSDGMITVHALRPALSGVQRNPSSIVQEALQPSSLRALPSSHCSHEDLYPSPQAVLSCARMAVTAVAAVAMPRNPMMRCERENMGEDQGLQVMLMGED